ncbi:hypothetical protein RJ640_011189, partial [Escallonia rubra]
NKTSGGHESNQNSVCTSSTPPPPPLLLSPPLLSPTMTSSSAPSRKALSKIACNRLQKELAEWQVNPPVGFKHKVTDNLQRWVIEVNGAPGTLYADEKFQLQVIFLHPAPLHPHIYSNGHICLVTFVVQNFCCQASSFLLLLVVVVQIRVHNERLGLGTMLSEAFPSSSNGEFAIGGTESLQGVPDILYDSWSPAMTVSSICISILSMLSSSTAKQRPEDNDRYVKNCRNGRSPKETRWWFHDDKV